MTKPALIKVQESDIAIVSYHGEDFISLTNMADGFNGGDDIENWLRNKNTLAFLGIWEGLNNPNFNSVEFDGIMRVAGLNTSKMSVKQWVEKTKAIGLTARTGKFGGTFAHKDIAFKFGAWLSPMFELLLIKEFQRLKDEESKAKNLDWNYSRFLSKVNYKVHTDAIKDIEIPALNIPKDSERFIYANEAEILNVALFGITSKEWRDKNPKESLKGLNIRDMADLHQLTVLANLQGLNAYYIRLGEDPKDRLQKLRGEAIAQLKSLRSGSFTLASIESPFKKLNESSSNQN